jgi:uncharacterized protein (TIGR03437 family)
MQMCRRFFCLSFLILAFITISACPLLAQPSALFYRTDYGLDFGISQATGLVTADFNNDGKLDFAFGAGYGIDVALGNGDGTFQPFMSFIPVGGGLNAGAALTSAVADFDGDGNIDLVLLSSGNAVVLPGKGDGTFGPGRVIAATPCTGGVSQVHTADLNGDGRPDLVCLTNNLLPVLSNATVLLNNGNFAFTSRTAFAFPALENGEGVAIADFNGDGVPDLAVITVLTFSGPPPAGVGHVYVGFGKGDGSFSSPITALALNQSPNFIAAADFNHDGAPDLAIDTGTTSIFLGNGDGSFRTAPGLNVGFVNPGTIAVADWTKSGNLGLGIFSAPEPQGIVIMAGNGDGTFYAAGEAALDPHSVIYQFQSADLNGDGLPDLLAVSGTSGTTVSVLLNAGTTSQLYFVTTSAASGITAVAPASIASLYANFPFIAAQFPTVSVNVRDSAGVTRPAPLFYLSQSQINLEIPAGTAPGVAAVEVASSGPPVTGSALVQNVVPTIFLAGSSAFPAAYAVAYGPDDQPQAPLLVSACQSNGCTPVAISRPAATRVFLELYATGIRNHVSSVVVALNGGQGGNEVGSQNITPEYAGPQGQFDGLDQVNVEITNLPSLPSGALYNLVLKMDGFVSNAVLFAVQ